MLSVILLAGLSMVSDPDGVVSTAPKGADAVVVGAIAPTSDARPDASLIAPTAQSLTTAQQIDRWIGTRAPGEVIFDETRHLTDDRQMHGFVSGSIGTNDYSAVDVGVSLPIGDTGRLDLRYSQSKNGYGYGYPGYGYGYGGYSASDFYGRGQSSFGSFNGQRFRVSGSTGADTRRSEPPSITSRD